MTRTFHHQAAIRSRVPLLIGLTGPSGGGKSKSALRLADGMRSVDAGKVFLVDTESNRALHYADEHAFEHVAFAAPFGPLDYVAALEHCVANGASVVIVDSVSHEWDGLGGVLDLHDREVQRMSGGDERKALAVNMLGWARAKKEHGMFVRMLLQIPCHVILCFRAKPKMKIKRGKEPEERGFMAIGAEDLIYELAANCLLMPGAKGVPTWAPVEEGEKATVKLPGWAAAMFPAGQPLDEATGAKLARWAAGVVVRGVPELLASYATCGDPATFGSLEIERRGVWKTASAADKQSLKAAADDAQARLKAALPPDPPHDPATGEVSQPTGDAT